MSVFVVPDGLAGERLDAAAARVTGYSRAKIVALIESGSVSVNSTKICKASHRLCGGELLEVDLESISTGVSVRPELADGVHVVHEDLDVIVVDKPVGVAAHPGSGWDGPSITEHLAAAGIRISTSGAPERQGVVQRLDVGTSGLMVLAKSEVAYTILKQAFRDRRVDKTYHALVQGHPDPFEGTIDAPIARHPGHDWKMAVIQGGRSSITHYRTLEAHRAATLLEIHLETGRTHQIRVHMAAIRHPCVGDPLYGADPALARRLGLIRQWLHAVELGFVHPGSGEYVKFNSPYPDDLSAALAMIRQS